MISASVYTGKRCVLAVTTNMATEVEVVEKMLLSNVCLLNKAKLSRFRHIVAVFAAMMSALMGRQIAFPKFRVYYKYGFMSVFFN